ncbi:hypothetical protein PVAP13_6NG285310 [Panicum virgatum]|uniref:Uncharacterized protein n=1 Tax=Panicum virgatum TaxID=38727 RepID=A0A8T0R3A4_PANVG|nr:hypothetical protein PVAP13_J683273 [Panicum virgatum]KAG2579720.1 hypothetical protein PVAP13_6NG285310 [Panicum virgatum]KAG2579721.1 hypothetical protein PVAP13_6NG285310 [Panicum virgatum]KAG2579727.1 hypothetical protein PVAP13_6NG285310 [Panicum virgatum]
MAAAHALAAASWLAARARATSLPPACRAPPPPPRSLLASPPSPSPGPRGTARSPWRSREPPWPLALFPYSRGTLVAGAAWLCAGADKATSPGISASLRARTSMPKRRRTRRMRTRSGRTPITSPSPATPRSSEISGRVCIESRGSGASNRAQMETSSTACISPTNQPSTILSSRTTQYSLGRPTTLKVYMMMPRAA